MKLSKRLKFFLSHLAISAIIAFLAIIIVFCVWYPFPLAKAIGVTYIFLMLLAIDIIVGPVLGFIVYKEGKKSLKMDLGVIIIIQLAALFYGIYSIFEGRPAWLVYNVDRFDLVRINEIDLRKVEKALPEYQNVSFLFPNWVAAVPPKNVNERNAITFEAVFSGVDVAQRPELYVDLGQAKKQIQSHVIALKELDKYNPKMDVTQILAQYPEATGFVPLKANAVDMVVLINKEKGEVVKIVDLRPWK